jgi:hypothetical protein
MSAQGNPLGLRPQKNSSALKGRCNAGRRCEPGMRPFYSAPAGLDSFMTNGPKALPFEPRALPWAGLNRARSQSANRTCRPFANTLPDSRNIIAEKRFRKNTVCFSNATAWPTKNGMCGIEWRGAALANVRRRLGQADWVAPSGLGSLFETIPKTLPFEPRATPWVYVPKDFPSPERAFQCWLALRTGNAPVIFRPRRA